MYMTKGAIMTRLNEHYEIAKEDRDVEIFGIFLQGSQNYINERFFANSDVDSRAIYIPSTEDICLNRDISLPELILDNEEHIDRFDVRKFLKLIKTAGINNFENLFTEYYIINPKYKEFYDKLVEIREDIARADEKKFVMSTMGISKRDFDFLERRTGNEDYDIETFGYSRKRLSNIIRFNETIKAYLAGKDFSSCLKAMDEDLIYKIRRTDCYTLAEAREIAQNADEETKKLAHEFEKESKHETYDKIDEIFVDLMKKSMGIEKKIL